MEFDIRKDGNVSMWNEGNFKNLRLHEAQEIINSAKLNPLKKVGNNYGYQIWYPGIQVLYGEGDSKYKQEELDLINKIKEQIDVLLLYYPPHK